MAEYLTVRPEARDEWRRLVAGLDLLKAAGRRTPCQSSPAEFVSEDRAERQEAARACAWCPLLEVCGDFARVNREESHVWGGMDLDVHPQTARRRRREAVAS